MAYLDTSVLGSYYCPESLSPAVNRAMATVSESLVSPLVELELCSLLALKLRTGALDRADATTVLAQFRVHLAGGFYRMVETGPREYELARSWLGTFATPLRTLDALHMATAFANGHELFTTDKAMASAAKQLGVKHRLIA